MSSYPQRLRAPSSRLALTSFLSFLIAMEIAHQAFSAERTNGVRQTKTKLEIFAGPIQPARPTPVTNSVPTAPVNTASLEEQKARQVIQSPSAHQPLLSDEQRSAVASVTQPKNMVRTEIHERAISEITTPQLRRTDGPPKRHP